MSLYDAIAKMTAIPAQRFRLTDKGALAVGADADVVIFDPDRIRDMATFADPIRPPEGIDMVLIGGAVAAREGKIVAPSLGRAVRV